MATICPAILAANGDEFQAQMQKVAGFAQRVQIDLIDGEFADNKTIPLADVSWPGQVIVDLHLMYAHPDKYIDKLIALKPHLVVIHAEASVDHEAFARKMHENGIKAGLAVLPETTMESAARKLKSFDHVLIFAGSLGHFGGNADLSQLEKAQQIKQHQPDIEIGWDGGVSAQNAKQIASSGVDVLNVGGFIQHAENPKAAYEQLAALLSGA